MSEVKEFPAGWSLYNEYENEVKIQNSYSPNEKFSQLFNLIASNKDNQKNIPAGTILYRARKNESGQDFKNVSDLGANKNPKSPNRASPVGVSYIYLAENPRTAIAEVRTNVNESVTVGRFKTKRKLNLLFLDQTAGFTGECGGFDSLEVASFIFFLSHAFAAPVQDQAKSEYLLTQHFAEICKSHRFDGIKYISSARGFRNCGAGHIYFNYVLFDDSNVSCLQWALKYKVLKISYKIKEHKTVKSRYKIIKENNVYLQKADEGKM